MNNISDITVVIPYYNESHVVKYCLDQIAKQTTPAKEAIFINSSSTDGTSDIIDRWIVENQPISVTKFKNFFKNTSNPGSSKNAGINLSTTKWVAFMDCGQIFPTDWLEKQCGYALKNNLDIVYGSVYLAGENWIDRCAVSQTYGYKRPVTCIPSSIVKRSVFTKIGLFLTGKRSGYDVAWRMQVEKNLMKYRTN